MLILVRHGESAANAAGLVLGRSESPLTARGEAQAQVLGSVLARQLPTAVGAVRVVSSPLGRARETAAALGLAVPVVDERWVELDFGAYDGYRLTEVPAEVWRRWREDPHFRPPGGETLAELGARVRAACDELFAADGPARDPEAAVVVVSHVSPIKAAVAWALGVGDELAWRLHLSTGSLTRIGWGREGPVLHAYNVVPEPDGARISGRFRRAR